MCVVASPHSSDPAAMGSRRRDELRPALRSVADRNCGVFTRRDAVVAGYTERELKTLTGRTGAWVVLRRGVYAERSLYQTCTDDGRYLLDVRASALGMARDDPVMTHSSAAVVHEMPIRPWWRDLAHTTRPDVRGGRTENGTKHHKGMLRDDDVQLVSGLWVTGLARTAVDIGREFGFEDGVVAADAALRMGATKADMERVVADMTCWPGIVPAKEAVGFADGGAANLAESLMRVMVGELGLEEEMETQFFVAEGSRTAYVDLRVGRHFFEFDGRVKYLGREEGGVADRPPSQVVWEEKQREDWLRRVHGGHGMSRVVWMDLFGDERKKAKRRLRHEYDETVRRFGRGAA